MKQACDDCNTVMRVDRNDIWWNLKQIKSNIKAADEIAKGTQLLYYEGSTWIDSDVTTSEMSSEEKTEALKAYEKAVKERENRENNYNLLKDFCDNSAGECYKSLLSLYEEMEDLYKTRVKKYENMDDEYKKKADEVYDQCTSAGERAWDIINAANSFIDDINKGFEDAVLDAVKGLLGLAGSIMVIEATMAVWLITKPFGETPEFVKKQLKESGDTLSQLLDDPLRIVSALGQGIMDALDTEGLAYGAAYAVGDTAMGIFLKKGFGKVLHMDDVSDAAKAANKLDDVGEAASGAKIVKSADDVIYNGKSVDKAFGKHCKDFGSYPDGSSSSVKMFEKDIKNLINTGVQKSGTWKGVKGTHIYNPTTQQWAFINADGTFNTAFKLSAEQFKFLLETGVVK